MGDDVQNLEKAIITDGESDREYCYRRKCRIVAWVDLILSTLCFILAVGNVICTLKTKSFAEFIDGYQQDAVWSVRITMEIICVALAAKLLYFTRISDSQKEPEKAAKWCLIWLINCGIWIAFLVIAIPMKMLEDNSQSESYLVIGAVVAFSTIVVVRLGAVYIVGNYWMELKRCSQQQQEGSTSLV